MLELRFAIYHRAASLASQGSSVQWNLCTTVPLITDEQETTPILFMQEFNIGRVHVELKCAQDLIDDTL